MIGHFISLSPYNFETSGDRVSPDKQTQLITFFLKI